MTIDLQTRYAVNETTGCWDWTGSRNNDGYGQLSWDGRNRLAHRVVYEVHVEPIAPDLELDHLCRNRGCVNPLHLEQVTHHVNTLRGHAPPGLNAAKTHCINGHEFTPENTWIDHSKAGRPGRHCRTCRRETGREASRRWRARKAAS